MSNLIISMTIAALGFAAGWLGNGWRLGAELQTIHATHAQERADQAEAFSQRRAALAQERDALADRLHLVDTTKTAQLTKAQNENKSLAARIAASTVGLRIDATCPSAGAGQAESAESGGVDSSAGAQLSAAAGQAYSALRENIVTTEVTLQACQSSLAEFQ
jgi:hypothetical protein